MSGAAAKLGQVMSRLSCVRFALCAFASSARLHPIESLPNSIRILFVLDEKETCICLSALTFCGVEQIFIHFNFNFPHFLGLLSRLFEVDFDSSLILMKYIYLLTEESK